LSTFTIHFPGSDTACRGCARCRRRYTCNNFFKPLEGSAVALKAAIFTRKQLRYRPPATGNEQPVKAFSYVVTGREEAGKTHRMGVLVLSVPLRDEEFGFVLPVDSVSVHFNCMLKVCDQADAADYRSLTRGRYMRLSSSCDSLPVSFLQFIKMFLAKRLIGGLIDVVGNIDPNQFLPSDPPPPRRPLAYTEQNESDEERQFRKVFQQLAGDDMEVSPNELMNILNKIIARHGDLKTDGFSIESCRSMVAVMDSDSSGRLGFHEFKHLWNNIKKWQAIYKQYDADRSGLISADELPRAFSAAGFPLNEQLFQMITRRYSDENGNMDFDNYIGCLVRLDAMCRAFKTLDKDDNGTIKVNIQEVNMLSVTGDAVCP
ncbi:CPNS1 protein, partial [Atractosteus spatula]|nr:CPNS1 protein [Atractosteus spatula]